MIESSDCLSFFFRERQYKLESEYTWLNISLERIHPDMNYVMEILKTGEIEHLFASEPLNSNRPNVFIKGLQPNSLFDVYLCDNRDLEFDHGISHVVTPRISRDRRCTKIKEIHTSDEGMNARNLLAKSESLPKCMSIFE